MEVLVTGGAGFIGSNIVDKLIEENYDVVIIDNLSTGKKEHINKKDTFYKADICSNKIENIFKKENVNIVIHTEAQIDVQKSINDPIYDCKNNIIGTLNILESCKKHKIEYKGDSCIKCDLEKQEIQYQKKIKKLLNEFTSSYIENIISIKTNLTSF